jgi:dedicator of cytokinesis protein 3
VQYEQHVFAYQRLSELLIHQADLYASIVTRTRYFPQHFLVGFYGQGFPLGVQNKRYVYRAQDWEKLGCVSHHEGVDNG